MLCFWRSQFTAIRIRSETYREPMSLSTKQRGRNPVELNLIRELRIKHSLTAELREHLAKRIRGLKTLRSSIWSTKVQARMRKQTCSVHTVQFSAGFGQSQTQFWHTFNVSLGFLLKPFSMLICEEFLVFLSFSSQSHISANVPESAKVMQLQGELSRNQNFCFGGASLPDPEMPEQKTKRFSPT